MIVSNDLFPRNTNLVTNQICVSHALLVSADFLLQLDVQAPTTIKNQVGEIWNDCEEEEGCDPPFFFFFFDVWVGKVKSCLLPFNAHGYGPHPVI